MTNTSAMTLVLLLFVAIFLAAVVLILSGGGWSEYGRPRKRHSEVRETRQHAA